MNILEGINKIITKLGSDKKVDNITDGLNQISENIGESGSDNGIFNGTFLIEVLRIEGFEELSYAFNTAWQDISNAVNNNMAIGIKKEDNSISICYNSNFIYSAPGVLQQVDVHMAPEYTALDDTRLRIRCVQYRFYKQQNGLSKAGLAVYEHDYIVTYNS